MSAVVISVCSLKGGTGKSSMSGGLAAIWAREVKRLGENLAVHVVRILVVEGW